MICRPVPQPAPSRLTGRKEHSENFAIAESARSREAIEFAIHLVACGEAFGGLRAVS